MPQCSVINSFRRRAEHLGYRNILIKKIGIQLYYIQLQEPLAGCVISFQCTEDRINKLLRRF